VHSDSVLCTASDAALTVEPVAGTHEQHCLLISCSVTAGRESKQCVASPAAVLGKASTNTTSLVLISAMWYVPQIGQEASEHELAPPAATVTVTLSPTANAVVIPTVMSAVENVFVAAAKAVAATLASVAAFTACQPVVASPVGAAIQVRAFHTPPRTDAQLASVASVVVHPVEDPAVHAPSGFESPSESLMHSACVKRSVAVGWLEAVAQVPHSPSTVAVVGELAPSHLPGTVQKNAAMQALQ